jgi:hypothetical protein
MNRSSTIRAIITAIILFFGALACDAELVREYNYHDDVPVLNDSMIARFIDNDIVFYYFFLGAPELGQTVEQLNLTYNVAAFEILHPDERLHSYVMSEQNNYLCFITEEVSGFNRIGCFDGSLDVDIYFELAKNYQSEVISYPYFSADGGTIFYYAHLFTSRWDGRYALYRQPVTNAEGNLPELVTECSVEPSIMTSNINIAMADGESFVFAGECDSARGIFIFSDGDYETLLESETVVGQPSLIRNDNEIIFLQDEQGGARDLYWMDLSERQPYNLTRGGADDFFWYPVYLEEPEQFVVNNGVQLWSFSRSRLLGAAVEGVTTNATELEPTVLADYAIFPDASTSGNSVAYLWEGGVYLYSYDTTTTIEMFPNYSTEPVTVTEL